MSIIYNLSDLNVFFFLQKAVFYNSNSSNRTESSNVFGNNLKFGSSSNTSSIFGGQQSSGFGRTGVGSSVANNIFSNKNQPSVFGSNSVFGTSTNKGFGNVNTSVFGSNQPTKSLFGGNNQSNQPTGIFGSSNSQTQTGTIFGTQSLSSGSGGGIFGSNTISANSNTNNVFGSAPKFGALNQPQQSVFGAQSQSNQTSNIFANNATSQPSNVFGQISSTASGGSIFGGGSNLINNSNPSAFSSNFSLSKFGANNSTNIFGTKSNVFQNSFNPQIPAQSPNVFNSTVSSDNVVSMDSPNVEAERSVPIPPSQPFSSSNIFQNQTISTAVLSTGSTITQSTGFGVVQASSSTPSIFGTAATSSLGAQSNAGAQDLSVSSIYTPLHLLSVEDKEEFERDVFLRIPLVPPPRELCV